MKKLAAKLCDQLIYFYDAVVNPSLLNHENVLNSERECSR